MISYNCVVVHPYEGRKVALATKHGKEQQIARPLYAALALRVFVPPALDTDMLGTFTGEVPRSGSPSQVVLQKARLGMSISGSPLGLANEGSFGPHPILPLCMADTELMLWVDDERGIQIQEMLISEQVVAAQGTARSFADVHALLTRAHFPTHGLVVRPHQVSGILSPDQIIKGITDSETLAKAIDRIAPLSLDGLALVETDLRAHMNPTRRRVIRRLVGRLARRLICLCPFCRTPGWGRVDVVRGLSCEWCGEATELVLKEVFGCPSCSYQEYHPRADGLHRAPAAQCPACNP